MNMDVPMPPLPYEHFRARARIEQVRVHHSIVNERRLLRVTFRLTGTYFHVWTNIATDHPRIRWRLEQLCDAVRVARPRNTNSYAGRNLIGRVCFIDLKPVYFGHPTGEWRGWDVMRFSSRREDTP